MPSASLPFPRSLLGRPSRPVAGVRGEGEEFLPSQPGHAWGRLRASGGALDARPGRAVRLRPQGAEQKLIRRGFLMANERREPE